MSVPNLRKLQEQSKSHLSRTPVAKYLGETEKCVLTDFLFITRVAANKCRERISGKLAKLNCSESVAPRRNIDAIQDDDDDIQRRYNAVLCKC